MGRGTLTAILLVSAVICGETAFAQVQPGETLRDAGDQPSPEAESQRYGATRGRRNVMPPFGGSFAGGGLIGDDNGFVYTSSTPGGFVGTGGFIGTPFFGMGGGSWPYDARMTPYAPYGPGLSGFLSNIMNFASQAANYPIPHFTPFGGYGGFFGPAFPGAYPKGAAGGGIIVAPGPEPLIPPEASAPAMQGTSSGTSAGNPEASGPQRSGGLFGAGGAPGFGGGFFPGFFGGMGFPPIGGPGWKGVFSSSQMSSKNVGGKVVTDKKATTGFSDDGKVVSYTMQDP